MRAATVAVLLLLGSFAMAAERSKQVTARVVDYQSVEQIRDKGAAGEISRAMADAIVGGRSSNRSNLETCLYTSYRLQLVGMVYDAVHRRCSAWDGSPPFVVVGSDIQVVPDLKRNRIGILTGTGKRQRPFWLGIARAEVTGDTGAPDRAELRQAPRVEQPVTLDQYNEIKTGMTVEEVLRIMGGPTSVETGTDESGMKVWRGGGREVTVWFSHGRVTMKAQD